MADDDNATSLRVASFSCYLSNPEESFVRKIGGTYEDPYPAGISPPDEIPFSITSARAARVATAKPSSNSTQDNLASLRIESFSSYLRTAEDNFAFKASAAPVQDPAIAFVFPQRASVGTPKQLDRNKFKDGEISIFGADKYFNMKLDYGAASVPSAGVKHMNLPHLKPNVKSGTPSICSEGSSWNSQNALLQNLERNGYQAKQKKASGRRFLTSFSCQGPCLVKKAVNVDKSIGRGISQPGSKHRVGHYALSSGPSETKKLTVVKRNLYDHNQSIEDQRKSLEVFGSGKMGKGDIVVNLERKLSMLTWDAIPKAQNLPTATTGGSSTVCDDMASDASSDLFEIENISSSNGYGLVNAHTTDDYMPGCMSPAQYAPSEASIDWSVVTASAVDYSSFMSDYDIGDRFSRNAATKTAKIKSAGGKEEQKTHTGGLLGCKNNKAVSVVETVHKTS